MSPTDEQKLIALLIPELDRWEGAYRHMYLDTKGLVTTGIGNLVATADDAVALPFVHMPFGEPADELEKRHAWGAVKAMPPGLRTRAYEAASNLRLTNEDVGALVAARLQTEFLPHLRKRLPHFDAFPHQAQMAMVDIVYNCGVGGFDEFHNLLEGALRQDWVACSKRCHRSSCREERNVWCASMFMFAYSQPLFV